MADGVAGCRASCAARGRDDLAGMDMHAIAEFEWAILLLLVLALALWELWRTRRAIRRAREREQEQGRERV